MCLLLLDSVMSACEVHSGESQLEGLCTFVDETNRWIDQTLATLGWTREHVVKVIFGFLYGYLFSCTF